MCRYPTPRAREDVAAMTTDKIRDLGWQPGGQPLLAASIAELAARFR